MKNIICLLCILVFMLSACSDNNNDAQSKKEHVWKEQKDTIEKARAVEGVLQENSDEQRKSIEDQTQ